MTTVEALAGWATGLRLEDVPVDVVSLCRSQRASVIGGIAASADDAASRRILDGLAGWARSGPAPLLGGDASVAVEDAIYAATALSIALDFDDYMTFAHTGHSAVLVPALLAAETGSAGRRQLVAQVVVNEVEARLAGACLIGPLNGQMWSFVHAAGSALAAGLLLELDERRLSHALALSLYQAPRPTVPGFMGPDSKLLTVAEPALIGVRAARLAASGVTGPLDVLDEPKGFLDAFSYTPLRGLLAGLGEGWASRTLCVKPYPGCAYVDTTLDALLSLDLPPAAEVGRVVVDASALACEMDSWSGEYPVHPDQAPTPVTVNFSVAWNVAIALLAGAVSPSQLRGDWLGANRGRLTDLARRVHLRHDWDLTCQAAEAFAGLLPPRVVRREAGLAKLGTGLARLGREHATVGGMSGVRGLGTTLWRRRGTWRAIGAGRYWSPAAIDSFRMQFPARVTVVLHGGQRLQASADVPRGGVGHPCQGPAGVAEAKLREWGPALWGQPGTKEVADAIATDHDRLFAILGR
ncbi:MAG TPA: MmgE/PrpD family protein [Acidimicrobiales bacterium]|nr:MmgE/PrpD family protein [Acidimicrobiales bacterium]